METFSIKTIEEAQIFNSFLNESWKISQGRPLLDEDYFEKIFELLYVKNRRLFYALIDIEITYFFMSKNISNSGGKWNSSFAPGKLEGGSVLDNFSKFHGKLEILENFSAFTFRCRAFWDKYMGALVLLQSPDEYDKFCKSRSRKKKFNTIAKEWSNIPIPIQNALIYNLQSVPNYKEIFLPHKDKGGLFPEPFLSIFKAWLEILDNKYRTPEAHGTGSIKKWSLSMLPANKSEDFILISHWNIVNSMARGLRETLKS